MYAYIYMGKKRALCERKFNFAILMQPNTEKKIATQRLVIYS